MVIQVFAHGFIYRSLLNMDLKMRLTIIIIMLNGVFLFGSTGGRSVSRQSISQKPYAFTLIAPRKNVQVVEGSITFTWEDRRDPEAPVHHYEIVFWSRTRDFRRAFTVIPEDTSSGYINLVLKDFRNVFRRHGTYFWQVTAYGRSSYRTYSEISSFIVSFPEIHTKLVPSTFPFEIQSQYVHRLRSDDYNRFLSTIQSTTQLSSFTDISFVFRQNNFPLRGWELGERLLLLSHVGFGLEFSTRFRIVQNRYVSIYTRANAEAHWYSTGLEDYSSRLGALTVGFDWVIMPNGYITMRTDWIPSYRIRYSEKSGGLRTFMGEGWSAGVRVIIPHHIMQPFTIFGMEFDFQRIPREFSYSEIRDDYTNTLMRMRTFTVGYLLQ